MRKLAAWAHGGDWAPGAHNMALLIVQLIVLVQAALRGFDYLQPAPEQASLSAVERWVPLTWWGAAFLLVTTMALVGLAGRWAGPIMAGHALAGSLYVGVGVGILLENGEPVGALAAAGMAVGLLGTWLVLRTASPTALRLIVGVPAMLTGQYLLSVDFGAGYRTGTGLIGAGLIHGVLAAGTLVLWIRQHAVVQVAQERAARIAR